MEYTAIKRRLVDILQRKREKLLSYRLILENQSAAVRNDEIDKVSIYSEMGRCLTLELEAVQNTLSPLESLYRRAYPETGTDQDEEIVSLSGEVLLLQAQVRHRLEENCESLRARMAEVRKELSSLRIPREPRPMFGSDTARRIDISS